MGSTAPILLDLFCKAGGTSAGYQAAGFQVIGVDIETQPHYPYEFHQMDWRDGLRQFGSLAQVIHASPPCKAHTKLQGQWGRPWVDLVTPVLAELAHYSKPWIVENVPGAPFDPDTILCGSMFGLGVRRHRWFRHNFEVYQPDCKHGSQGAVVQVNGHCGGSSSRDGRRHHKGDWCRAMEIDWMTTRELAQAIPPAYTEYIGWYAYHVL